MRTQMNRRDFLKTSTTAAAAIGFPNLIPASAFGAGDKVALGCIGVGIQGMGNMRTFRRNPEVRVVAVCDVHETQRNRAK